MASMLIRWNDTDHAAFASAAALRGLSAEEFARRILSQAAAAPLVRERYGYRAIGPGKATLVRHGDGPGNVGGGADGLSQEQYDAYQRAKALMQRNEAGDQAEALALLQAQFEIVVEVAV